MTETEVIEMFVPSVSMGRSVGIPDMKVTIEDSHAYDEIVAEHVNRGDFHAISAYMAENLPDKDIFYNFVVPTENVILSLAQQAEAQFKARGIPKKVAIVGFADSKKDAPYKDPGFEIWGLNDLHGIIPRWTRWFDIHTPEVIDIDVKAGRAPPDKCGIGGLSHLTCPVYMQERNPAVPNSVKFPLEEILQTFSKLTGSRYFTNSISYMIAYALYEGIITGHQWDEIHVYGVDMAVGTEYEVQRASCEYWIGIAEGMGVKCYIPDSSDLNKTTFVYAFETKRQMKWEVKIDETVKSMEERLTNIRQAIDANTRAAYQHEGAIGCIKEMKKVWSNLDTKFK